MEADDFLAYQMDIGWPELLELLRIIQITNRSQVVGKGIEPYIYNMLVINRHRNTPVKGGTGDAEILHALIDEINHLVAAGYWLDKIRIFLNVLQQAVCVFANLEEICLLRNLLDSTMTIWAAAIFIQLMLSPVAFAWSAVKASVGAFVNITLGVNAAEDFLHNLLVTLFRGADKIIIGDIQQLPQVLESCHDRVYVFNRGNALLLSLLLNLLAVLVAASQEENILPCQTVETGYRVGNGGAVSVADMQLGTRVINWGSDIEAFFIQN